MHEWSWSGLTTPCRASVYSSSITQGHVFGDSEESRIRRTLMTIARRSDPGREPKISAESPSMSGDVRCNISCT